MKKPQFDIILFGATSFVGRLVALHIQSLLDSGSTAIPASFSWAIAGRNMNALQRIKTQLGAKANGLPCLVADSHNKTQLQALCRQCRVVISTVGPYALYGETLVQVCTESGTDYCDLTGEVPWIKRMLYRYEVRAQTSGARIVNCCGFDSIPSDLGVHYLQQLARCYWGGPATQIKMAVEHLRGGLSGGTLASIINVSKEAIANQEIRKQLSNPYWLCPQDQSEKVRQPSHKRQYDQDFESWTIPFLMAGINTRIVHRSNALLNYSYGREFIYSEQVIVKKFGRLRSAAMQLTTGVTLTGIIFPPTRWLLQRFVLPKPGQGPSAAQQQSGFFSLLFVGKNAAKQIIRTRLQGDRDPGYSGTAKMLTQAGLCLAFDVPITQRGGFYTPAALMAEPLQQRLTKYAGITLQEISS